MEMTFRQNGEELLRVKPGDFTAKAPRMKETGEDAKVRDRAYRVAASELRGFVERYEKLQADKDDIAGAQKEVLAEARGRGYDTKVLRKLIALRRRDPAELAEEEALIALYREALEGARDG